MARFTTLWAGFLTSITGSALTGFALGLWVFQQTGSATQFGLIFVLSFLPGILLAPLAGALVDRWNRKAILLASEVVGIATTGVLAALVLTGTLQPWHVAVTTTIRAILRTLQMPAFNSLIVLMVPKEQVGRANGMVMTAQAISQTLGPAVGGLVLIATGLSGVLLIDCATFVIGTATILAVAIPPTPRFETASAGSGSLGTDIRIGWQYLTSRRDLVVLMLFYAALDFGVGYADVLITPFVATFAPPAALGTVLTIGGGGLLLGGLAMTAWGGPRRRVWGLAGFALPLGLFLGLGALQPSVPLVAVAAFGFMFCSVIVDGTTRSVLQLTVEPDVQGRVFALFGMLTNAILCLSYLLAGPVADNLVEPLLRPDGALAGSVGRVLGVGPGRGMALIFFAAGVLIVVVAMVGMLSPTMRHLPDRPVRSTSAAPSAQDKTQEETAQGVTTREETAGASAAPTEMEPTMAPTSLVERSR